MFNEFIMIKKTLLLLALLMPCLLSAQEIQGETQNEKPSKRFEYMSYDGSSYVVSTSKGVGYFDDGFGYRKLFDNNMQVISYLGSMGWKLESTAHEGGQLFPGISKPLQYVFSKDVTGWTQEEIDEFIGNIKLTKRIQYRKSWKKKYKKTETPSN